VACVVLTVRGGLGCGGGFVAVDFVVCVLLWDFGVWWIFERLKVCWIVMKGGGLGVVGGVR